MLRFVRGTAVAIAGSHEHDSNTLDGLLHRHGRVQQARSDRHQPRVRRVEHDDDKCCCARADVPAVAADLEACDKDDKPFKPELANVAFKWTETPSLADAPADGAYMQIGSGPVMKAEEVEIWVDKKRSSFDQRTRTS
jgi:hypothetical protein